RPSLDEFLLKYARQNQKTGVSRTFVALKPAERIVCGYYSLSAGAVARRRSPEEQRKPLTKYPVPVAHLGRLAVAVKRQGQRLGEFLLVDALRAIQAAAASIGIHTRRVCG